MTQLVVAMLWFVVLYPVVTAAFWIAGGLVFRLSDEAADIERPPPEGWVGVSMLIPAHNEERVIERCVSAALAVDYPELEVLVLDDGSTDGTAQVAAQTAAGDPRLEVVQDTMNLGKAERINHGLRRARHDLVIVCDADTHIHPLAPKLLVARLLESRLNVAVAAGPHVTNRTNLLSAMQVIETASIIGLIRRTAALRGRVGTVAGVLALFRREPVLEVGGFRGQMATEDIDLTWRLLLAGWHTAYEPNALIGMEVPTRLSALWAQRCRWARGQGEVLHEQFVTVRQWRNRGMWPIALESVLSLIWVVSWGVALLFGAIALFVPSWHTIFGLGFAWGVAIALICVAQSAFALSVRARYDMSAFRVFLLGPLYPLFFWAIAALAALRAELPALIKGPTGSRVVWDIPRDPAGRTTTS